MSRCLLISNRLPFAYNSKQGAFVPSAGGLASAIKGLDPKKVGFEFEWMGILTDDVYPEKLSQLKADSSKSIPCHPIIVRKEDYDNYYNSY